VIGGAFSFGKIALAQENQEEVEVEYEPWHEIPSGFPSERAGIYYVSGGGGYPIFCDKFIADPDGGIDESRLKTGELQVFSIGAKDPKGIEKVIGKIKFKDKEILFEMKLIEGTVQEGKWIGAWKVRSGYPDQLVDGNSVKFELIAFNTEGETTRVGGYCFVVPTTPPQEVVPTTPPQEATQDENNQLPPEKPSENNDPVNSVVGRIIAIVMITIVVILILKEAVSSRKNP